MEKLHFETVSPILRDSLLKLMTSPVFEDYVLVGGTSLSLQLGHRISLDIDLFTAIEYGKIDRESIAVFLTQNFKYVFGLDDLDQDRLGYSFIIGNSKQDCIKLDLYYTEPYIFPILEKENIRLADMREIAAMKIGAISQDEPRQKDFWDINELSKIYSLKDMISWGLQRQPYSLTEEGVLEGFRKIDDTKECPEGISCLKGNHWDLVKMDIKELFDDYCKTI